MPNWLSVVWIRRQSTVEKTKNGHSGFFQDHLTKEISSVIHGMNTEQNKLN
jgi:hypothetical protein